MQPQWKRIPEFTGDDSIAPFNGECVLIWKFDERMVGEYMMVAYFDCRDTPGFIPTGGHHKQGYYSEVAQRKQGYPTHWAELPEVPDRDTWVWDK